MKKNSLVVPSPRMIKEIPYMLSNFNFTFKPCIPNENSVFTCTSDVYTISTGAPCIAVDRLKVYYNGSLVHLDTFLFVEVQGPNEVNVEEIVEDSIFVIVNK